MPYTKHCAIIVGRTLKGDSDKNLLLVLDDGRKVEASIRKARDSFARWSCITEPVSLVEVELYAKKNKNTIVSMQLKRFYANIPKNITSALAEALIFELIESMLPFDIPENCLFDSLNKTYQLLNMSSQNHFSVLVWFMSDFLSVMGYHLQTNSCQLCGSKIDSDCFFDIKRGSVLCHECSSKGMIPLPNFARKAISVLEFVEPDGLSFDDKLAKGLIELFSRVIHNRFDINLKTSLHIKAL